MSAETDALRRQRPEVRILLGAPPFSFGKQPISAKADLAVHAEQGGNMREQASSTRIKPVQADDLYFIQGSDGPVKIGRSQNVWKRLQNLQSGSPVSLECVCVLGGRGHEEKAWHAAFGDQTVRLLK